MFTVQRITVRNRSSHLLIWIPWKPSRTLKASWHLLNDLSVLKDNQEHRASTYEGLITLTRCDQVGAHVFPNGVQTLTARRKPTAKKHVAASVADAYVFVSFLHS